MQTTLTTLRSTLAWLAVSSMASAQDPMLLAEPGDPVPGGSFYERFDMAGIDENGSWTTTADAVSPARNVLVRDGKLLLRTGSPLPGAPGLRARSIADQSTGPSGRLGTVVETVDVAGGTSWTVFVDGTAILSDGAQLPPGPYPANSSVSLQRSRIRMGQDELVLLAEALPPNTSFGPSVLLRLRLDAAGQLENIETIAAPGMRVQPTGEAIKTVRLAFDVNASGSVLYTAILDGGLNGRALLLDGKILVRGEDPSPVAGFTFYDVWLVDLNNRSDVALLVEVWDGSERKRALLKNGAVVAIEGQVLNLAAPRTLRSLALNEVADSSQVFWEGTLDNGWGVLLRDDEILVSEFSIVGGRQVYGVNGFDVSSSGRFLVGEVLFDPSPGARSSLMRMDLGAALPFSGCVGNAASLEQKGGFALPGQTLRLRMENAQGAGALAVTLVSTRPDANFPCGTLLPFGELLIDLGPGNPVANVAGTLSGTGADVDLALPNDLNLVEAVFYAQGFFVDQASSPPLRATNGLEILVGAP